MKSGHAGSPELSKHAKRVERIRLALRPLFPRVVAPLEGRSSGSWIIRFDTPSQSIVLDQWLIVSIVPSYSDGLAPDFHRLPASRKLLLDWLADSAFESFESKQKMLRPSPPMSVIRLSLGGTPSTVGGRLPNSPMQMDPQEASSRVCFIRH
jgi:hypothetical protein